MVVSRRLILLVTSIFLGSRCAACGTSFPMELFADREQTQRDLPSYLFVPGDSEEPPDYDSFFRQLSYYLIPFVHGGHQVGPLEIPQNMTGDFEGGHADDKERELREQELLDPDLFAAVQDARERGAPLEKTATLPDLVRLYTGGAVLFNQGNIVAAKTWFEQAVLQPKDARYEEYRLWSYYMLGRIASDDDSKGQMFKKVRDMARAGTPDVLGLASATRGDEARVLWQTRSDVPGAVYDYVEMAADDSPVAWDSLRVVSEGIVDAMGSDKAEERKQAQQWLQNKEVRTIVLTFLYSRPYMHGSEDPSAQRMVETLSTVFAGLPAQADNGISRMAAVAWLHGRYDLAERWAPKGDDALGWWIRGKLAWRRGDAAGARAAYDTAMARLQTAEATDLRNDMNCRISGERALLATQDGKFVEAARLMKTGGLDNPYYWWDMAYLADRILTVDELGAFVKETVPVAVATTPPPPVAANTNNTDPYVLYRQLMDLYGRRLMRAGRVQEAEMAFNTPEFRDLAHQYRLTLALAQGSKSSANVQAEHWFELARLTREHGMELFGYTLAPDLEDMGGMFPLTENHVSLAPAEAERFAATQPRYNHRYHYRDLAVDDVDRAAALLPRHSQTYAATLCWGNLWVNSTDPDRAAALYQQYVHHGAHMDWAPGFGKTCPEPRF